MSRHSFVYKKDDFLSKGECVELINTLKKEVKVQEDSTLGYESIDIESTPVFESLAKKLLPPLKRYGEIFPESYYTTEPWGLTQMRFKTFRPGKSFANWHSEHGVEYPLRVLNIMIYLSDHNCGTQFYNGEVIKSVAGRLVIFPSYFTHAHKGQPCPDNKTRYLLTGYVNFLREI